MHKKAKIGEKTKKSKPLQPEEYEELILNHLKQYPSGLTITDVSKGIGVSRITVNKYILLLEANEKVFSKDIGAYTLFFSSERTFLPWRTIASFYQGILTGVSEVFSGDKEAAFKQIGKKMNRYLTFPVGSGFPKSLKKPIKGSYKELFNYYAEIYGSMDYMIDKKTKIKVEIDQSGTRAIYTLSNVSLLEENENYVLHFHIVCGMIEKTLQLFLKDKDVKCQIEEIESLKVRFSIEII